MKLPLFLLCLVMPVMAQAPALTNEVRITTTGQTRRVQSNGIPDHAPGQFPNARNPNTIRAQDYDFRMPLSPQKKAAPAPYRMQPFGVAVNGVVLDPFAAEWWRGDPSSGWQYEPQGGAIDLGLDEHNAHVQPNGAYHYHGIPTGLLQRLSGGENKPVLLGWAADGFPIYGPWGPSDPMDLNSPPRKLQSGYRVKAGARPADGPGGQYDGSFVQDYEWAAGHGDLDKNNGRHGVTPEFPQGTYYYVLTDAYPFIPRQFAGEPDRSFERRGPGGPGGMNGPPGMGPPGRRPPPPPGGGRRGGPGFRPPPPPF
jgi:hypothetical protein